MAKKSAYNDMASIFKQQHIRYGAFAHSFNFIPTRLSTTYLRVIKEIIIYYAGTQKLINLFFINHLNFIHKFLRKHTLQASKISKLYMFIHVEKYFDLMKIDI